jgi:2-dehydro-3-deoxygluconokinase
LNSTKPTLVSAPKAVVTIGETMALMYSTNPGPLAHAHDMTLGIGGAESNFAIALERLGTRATWIGRIGDDSLGEKVVRELRAEGLAVHAVTDPTAPTGLMIKERRTAEASRVWYYRTASAGSHLASEDIPEGVVESAALLHITGITPALSDSAAKAITTAIDRASQAAVPVSFDVNHRSSLWSDRNPTSVYRELAVRSTIVFAGYDEARLVVPEASGVAEVATAITKLGPSQVIIKLGADGCLALVDGSVVEQSAVPVTPVDTVGAGDAFVAGYVSEYVAEQGISTRLKTAVTAGAFACLTHGDWEGMPRRTELGLLNASEPVTR